MVRDNLELIKPLLNFETEGYFYVIYVMTRNKDLGITTPEKAQKNRVIKEYYIESLEYLDRKYSEIKKLCECFNARAYINLNRINKHNLGLELLDQLVIKLKHDDSNYLNLLSKAIGNSKTDNRVWVVDIDSEGNYNLLESLKLIINNIRPLEKDSKVLTTIPTVNGHHLLTKPFDLKQFNEECLKQNLKVDVQKNNPTLLYYGGNVFRAKVYEPKIRPSLSLSID